MCQRRNHVVMGLGLDVSEMNIVFGKQLRDGLAKVSWTFSRKMPLGEVIMVLIDLAGRSSPGLLWWSVRSQVFDRLKQTKPHIRRPGLMPNLLSTVQRQVVNNRVGRLTHQTSLCPCYNKW